MKTDLTFKGGNGRRWTGVARWALVAAIGVGTAVLGSGACSATPTGTDFNTGGSGSQSGGTQSGGTQSGSTQSGGTQSGGTQSGGVQSGGTQSVGTFVGSGGAGPGSSNNSVGVGGACASSHYEGKLSPLDIYIMLDKSGSVSYTHLTLPTILRV